MNTNILLLLGGGAVLLWWLNKDSLPADAVYQGQLAAGQKCPATGATLTATSYAYYSPSTKLWYCTSKTPAAAPAPTPGTSPTPGSAPAGSAPAAPAPPAATPAPAPVAAPYSQTLQRIKDAINSSGVSTTYIFGLQAPDVWNWYAMQAIPGWTAPAPESMYPGVPDAHKPVTFTDWWGRVQAFLPSGLSGFQPRSQLFNRVYGGWMA